MSLILFDSARKYVSSLAAPVGILATTNMGAHATNGRDGGPTFQGSGANAGLLYGLSRTWVAGEVMIFGLHVRLASLDVPLFQIGTSSLATAFGTTGRLCRLYVNSSGQLEWRSPDTVRVTSTLTVITGQDYFFEVKVTFQSGATGTVQVQVDGVDFIGGGSGVSGSSKITYNGGTVARIGAGGGSSSSRMDVFYVCDNQNGQNDDFLGNVTTTKPAIDANSSVQFTPSAGSNYQNVDENPADDDTTYNSSGTVGDKDLFTHAGGFAGTIFGLQFHARVRKETTGTTGFKAILSSGGVESKTALVVPGTTYTASMKILEEDPNTSDLWDPSDANAALVGYENTITA